jgi:ribosomal protein S18 acetylase RimI-like enzyme
MDVVIRRASEADWRQLRRVRIQALADSPTAFGTTLEEAEAFPEQRWRDRARGSDTARQFLAWSGEQPVGLAGLIIEPGYAEVVSVWVRPDQRGRGVARKLMDAAIGFAVSAGAADVRLWVTDGDSPARALYERLGFRATGERQPLPSNPSIEEVELVLGVSPRPGDGGSHE